MLERLGARTREVRRADQLEGLDGLVIPGGESTTISKLMDAYGLAEPIRAFHARRRRRLRHLRRPHHRGPRHRRGRAADARPHGHRRAPQRLRAPGAQLRGRPRGRRASARAPLRAVFIRAPWVESAGPGVEVLATCEGHIVAAREGGVLVTAFHPELTDDTRLHELFIAMIRRGRARRPRRRARRSRAPPASRAAPSAAAANR